MVKAWSPDFDPLRDEIVTTPVWVRIANLPINFYHRTILMGIAEGLGKPIKVDLTTVRVERARFARVCVEVNLKKPLKGTIMVNGERYYVSYEGLSNICPVCGVFGHAGSVCPKRVSELVVQQTVAGNVTVSESEVGLEAVAKVSDGFTEVRNTGRRSGKTGAQGVKVFSAGGSGERQTQQGLDRVRDCSQVPMVLSNSFSGLEGETEVQFLSKEICSKEENKENEQNTNMVNQVNDLNRSVGKQIVGRPVTEKIGTRSVELERKTSGNKTWKNTGVKGKNMKGNAPTRGLIFGPTSGEVSGLATGKRLRVEHDNGDRAGGAYTSVCTGNSVLKLA